MRGSAPDSDAVPLQNGLDVGEVLAYLGSLYFFAAHLALTAAFRRIL